MIRRVLLSLALFTGCLQPMPAQQRVPDVARAYELRLRSAADSTVVLAKIGCRYGDSLSRVGCVKAERVSYDHHVGMMVFTTVRLTDSAKAWKPDVDSITTPLVTYAKPEPQAPMIGHLLESYQPGQLMLGVDKLDSAGVTGAGQIEAFADGGAFAPSDIAVSWCQTLSVNGDSNTCEPEPACLGHGAHVAGDGVSKLWGVAKDAQAGIVKTALPGCGFIGYDICRMLYAAIDHNARTASASIGGTAMDQTCIDHYVAWGGIFCAAAGNDGGVMMVPARQTNVLGMAALDESRNLASYSSHGYTYQGQNIFPAFTGPANNILSDGDCATAAGCPAGSVEAYKSGSSMWSPAGCALFTAVMGIAPHIARDTLVFLFDSTAIDLGQIGVDSLYGHGLPCAICVVQALIARGWPQFINHVSTPCAVGVLCSGHADASGSMPFDVFPTHPEFLHTDSIVGRRVYWSGVQPADSLGVFPSLHIRGQ